VNFLKDLALLATPLLGTLVLAETVLSSQSAIRPSSRPGPASYDLLTPGFVSVLVIFALFYGLRRRGEQVARLVIAGITVAGTLSGLVLLQLWFESSKTVPVLFYLLAAPLGYVGLYWSFRSYSGSLSKRKSGLLMMSSCIFLGALIGISFPLIFTILLLFALSLLDVLVVESDLLRKTVGRGKYDTLLSVTTLPFEKHVIGLGDFLVYSMLAASSLRNGGLYVAGATIALILVGSVITSRIARSRLRVPGLPIPIWLGLVPSMLGLLLT
jgi:hypothetical protein